MSNMVLRDASASKKHFEKYLNVTLDTPPPPFMTRAIKNSHFLGTVSLDKMI